MLSISPPVKGSEGGKYYAESYYCEQAQNLGFLSGGGAKLLNHPGPITKEEFTNLLRGFSPDGKEKLVQNAGSDNRQSGWDGTFSGPKPLSVLYGLSSESYQRIIRSIIYRAGAEGGAVLEEVGGWSRRGKAGCELDKASLVFLDFLHETSRANEPAIHIHKFIFNLGFRPDGTTGALWTEEIFRNKLKAGQVFRDALARMLQTELGLELEPRKVGFHIKGVPQELCDVFSTRRKQILKTLADAGLSSAVAAKIAALKTRPKKQHIPRNELRAYWARVGSEFGFGPEQAESLLREGQQRLAQSQATGRSQEAELSNNRKEKGSDSDARSSADDRSRSQESRKGEEGQSDSQDGSRRSEDGRRGESANEFTAKAGNPFFQGPPLTKKELLFPYAPEWSPFKNLKVTHLHLGSDAQFRRWGNIVSRKNLLFAEIRIQEKYLFPNATVGSLRKWSFPALRILSPSQLRQMKAKAEHFQKVTERLSH